MKIIHDFETGVADDVETVVGIGAYDGIHRGHQYVLSVLRSHAAERGCAAAVVTFDQHPALVLRPKNAPKMLTSLEQRLELIEEQGIDYVYLVKFDAERATTPPETFVKQVFVERLHASAVVVGADFHFGRGREGNVDGLTQLGSELEFDVVALELIDDGRPEPISSTVIRRLLAGGDVAGAAELLGRPYEIRGEVIEGEQRGRTIGFPTANIPVTKHMAWPADGVYAGWFIRADGSRHQAAINIGRRPTFHLHAEHSLLEAHLVDFDGDLYGERVRVQFVEFLRSERRFEGIDALASQLKLDVSSARGVLSS